MLLAHSSCAAGGHDERVLRCAQALAAELEAARDDAPDHVAELFAACDTTRGRLRELGVVTNDGARAPSGSQD